jgi:hypothetical protein
MCRNKDKQAIYVSAGNMVNEAFNISINMNMNMIWCLWWLILMSVGGYKWFHDTLIPRYDFILQYVYKTNNSEQ